MMQISLPVFKQHGLKKQEKKGSSVLKLTVGVFVVVMLISLLNILDTDLSKYVLGSEQNRKGQFRRSLAVNLGGGQCEWKDPVDAPQDSEIFSTLLTAYPGSGKRAAFMQIEGMTELRSGDDYRFTDPNATDTKYAFMKTSYPHHEGTWSFGNQMSQTILLVRNPRWALVSYHSMSYELDYPTNWSDSYKRIPKVYTMKPPVADWVQWRNTRFDLEIKKWGWFIDYWMEGGLLRDILTNDLTTAEHFKHTTQPLLYGEAELASEQVYLGVVSPPEYDEHCVSSMEDCKPVAIASFEKMVEKETGPEEVDRFLASLEGKAGISVIEKEARECVWKQLMVEGKGTEKTFKNRKGPPKNDFGFRPPEMRKIRAELERLRDKYSSGDWINDPIAQSLVGYLDGYIAENGQELKFVAYN